MRLIICLVGMLVLLPLFAQPLEPALQLSFTPDESGDRLPPRTGTLEASILPPDFDLEQEDSDSPVEVTLVVRATIHSGRWLMDEAAVGALSDEEVFVRDKFRLFRTAEQPEQYRQLLDQETYATFSGAVARGEIDLAVDREFYSQYDNIRMLGSVRYGVYTLLYVQFRPAESGQLQGTVMPARRVNDRLLTAGSLHASSHALYRMLAFGTLQRRLLEYLETLAGNPPDDV